MRFLAWDGLLLQTDVDSGCALCHLLDLCAVIYVGIVLNFSYEREHMSRSAEETPHMGRAPLTAHSIKVKGITSQWPPSIHGIHDASLINKIVSRKP